MSAARQILSRILSAIVTLFVVSLAVFVAVQLVPGGYEDVVLGPFASADLRAQVAAQYGLDQSIPVQYLKWLGGVLQGDLGTSMISQQSVMSELVNRLPATIELVVFALAISIVVGVSLGLISGLARNSFVRTSTRLFGSLTLSVPDFVVGTALVYLFSVNVSWFTIGGYEPFFEDPVSNIRSTVLPALTLGLFGIAMIMRTQRDSVRSVLTQPFVTASVARGDRKTSIVRRHVLRNSSAPVVTIVAVLIGAFLSGTVIVETLFSIPGIGVYFVSSVRNRDFAVVQAVVLLSATVFIVANMLADILYSAIDPRVGSASAARR